MSEGASTARRVIFLLSMSATLVFVLAAGAGNSSAKTSQSRSIVPARSRVPIVTAGPKLTCEVRAHNDCSVTCALVSETMDATNVHANWCWDIYDNLTSLSWGLSQASHWTIFAPFGITVDTKTGGVGSHTASETFTSTWITGTSPANYCYVNAGYWVHVVGGSTNLDFTPNATTTEGDCTS